MTIANSENPKKVHHIGSLWWLAIKHGGFIQTLVKKGIKANCIPVQKNFRLVQEKKKVCISFPRIAFENWIWSH